MRHFFVALYLVMSIGGIALAQSTPPLTGTLIAANTVQRDAIILYSVADDRYRHLNFGTLAHHVWDFSADGCEVLFTLQDGTLPPKLFAASLDGSQVRELVAFDELESNLWGVWEPDWSPDGTRIAFTMIRDIAPRRGADVERQHHIAWIPMEGGTPEFYSVTGREFSPQWSPDGTWLAYVSYDERVAGASAFATAIPTEVPPPDQTPVPPILLNEADLWLVSADAITKYRLTNFSTGSVSMPRWSPDGELIAFTYSPSPNNDMVWMISRQQGAIPTQLSNQWSLMLDLTWLPDSTHIIAAMRDFRNISANRLWRVPLVGLADENAVLYLPDALLEHADYPRFSPDGQWLLLRSSYHLALMTLTSNQVKLLDATTLGNTPAVWSPLVFETETACSRS